MLNFLDSNGLLGIVDSAGNVGQSASLVLDKNDAPHISYYDVSRDCLKYASWNGTGWQIEIVDSGNISVRFTQGSFSLALDSNGYPRILYSKELDYYSGKYTSTLKYAEWTGQQWRISVVDTVGINHMSLALDSKDIPHIAYGDIGTSLRYATWNGTGWSIERLDDGASCSIAVDTNDHPHISYESLGSGNGLTYASWNGTGWALESVDLNSLAGSWSSLALDAKGYPHISYIDSNGNANVKYTSWNGKTWNIFNVDPDTDSVFGEAGFGTSLALDSSGNPYISYFAKQINQEGFGNQIKCAFGYVG